MQFQQFDSRYVVRIESGERVMETLTTFLRERDVGFATLSAIGAVRWVELGYWNAQSRTYEFHKLEEQLEVLSFQGTCSHKREGPFLHMHGVFGRRDLHVFGGHVREAQAHPTLEVWLQTEPAQVRRARDEASGLDLLQLEI